MLLSSSWASDTLSGEVQSVAQHALSLMEAQAAKQGRLLTFKYLNYAAPYQEPMKSYGPDNLGFLQKVARNYDPKRLFQTQLPGGFKL